jgi:hypothetical protein
MRQSNILGYKRKAIVYLVRKISPLKNDSVFFRIEMKKSKPWCSPEPASGVERAWPPE